MTAASSPSAAPPPIPDRSDAKRSVRWRLILVGIALLLLAYGLRVPVDLLTADEVYADDPERIVCYTSGTSGELVVDESAGTAVIEQRTNVEPRRVIVIWPAGYTARRSWANVEVLNPQGAVRATTGTSVRLVGGYPSYPDNAFLACHFGPVVPDGE